MIGLVDLAGSPDVPGSELDIRDGPPQGVNGLDPGGPGAVEHEVHIRRQHTDVDDGEGAIVLEVIETDARLQADDPSDFGFGCDTE